jgi:dihydrofolate reductase
MRRLPCCQTVHRCWTGTTNQSTRLFSVKELPWCSPSRKSANRVVDATVNSTTDHVNRQQQQLNSNHGQNDIDPTTTTTTSNESPLKDETVVRRFGIVSAMSKNRIIGVQGKVPWNVPSDRQHFKDLTRDKIVIVGRKTYGDTPDELNIGHARRCIVVSTTAPEDMGSEKVQVARSFPEALYLAKQLEETAHVDKNDTIDCWVCGGERLYLEALHHKSAYELHLTVLDTIIDVVPLENGQTPEVAFFPAKYRWDRFFVEVSRRHEVNNSANSIPDCSYVVYRRKVR